MNDQQVSQQVQKQVYSFVSFFFWIIVFVAAFIVIILLTVNVSLAYKLGTHIADNFLNYAIMLLMVLIIGLSMISTISQIGTQFKDKVDYNQKNKSNLSSAISAVSNEQLKQFILDYNGKIVADPNGYYEGECVSLVKLWHNYIKAEYTIWQGNYPIPAYQSFKRNESSILNDNANYKIIAIDKFDDIQAGDTLILNTYGRSIPSHTAIAVELNPIPTLGAVRVFEQNNPLGGANRLHIYEKNQFYGALRTIKK